MYFQTRKFIWFSLMTTAISKPFQCILFKFWQNFFFPSCIPTWFWWWQIRYVMQMKSLFTPTFWSCVCAPPSSPPHHTKVPAFPWICFYSSKKKYNMHTYVPIQLDFRFRNKCPAERLIIDVIMFGYIPHTIYLLFKWKWNRVAGSHQLYPCLFLWIFIL